MKTETDSAPSFLPRLGDLTVSQLVEKTNEILSFVPPEVVSIYFKFTCMWCGTRCTFSEPNTIYKEGECDICKKTTPFTMGGMDLVLTCFANERTH